MSHSDALLLRLEMQITRARSDRLGKELIDETNHRCADIHVGVATLIGDEAQVLYVYRRRDGIGSCRGRLGIHTIELSGDLVRRRNLPPHSMASREPDGTFGIKIEGIRRCDDEDPAIDS
jgi:hypothetical protein